MGAVGGGGDIRGLSGVAVALLVNLCCYCDIFSLVLSVSTGLSLSSQDSIVRPGETT